MANQTGNAGQKAQYAKPKLTVYGEFANLTAAATGSLVEGPNMMSNMRMA